MEKLESITLEEAEEMVKEEKAKFMPYGYNSKTILRIEDDFYLLNELEKKI